MKKIIPILLALVLAVSFTACGDKKVSSNTSGDGGSVAPANEYGCFTYPDTEWGMTEAEVIQSLDIDKKDFVLTSEDNNQISASVTYEAKQKLFESDVTAKFFFVEVPMSSDKTLRSVTITCPNVANADEFKTVCDKLGELATAQNAKFSGGGIANQKAVKNDNSEDIMWVDSKDTTKGDVVMERQAYGIWSVADVNSLPQDIKDGYNSLVIRLFDDGELSNPPTNYKTTDFAKSINEPLCRLSANFTTDKISGETNCEIVFTGNIVAQVVGYAETFQKLPS